MVQAQLTYGLGGYPTYSWLAGQMMREQVVLVVCVADLVDLDVISTQGKAERNGIHSLGEIIGTSGVGAEKWESWET